LQIILNRQSKDRCPRTGFISPVFFFISLILIISLFSGFEPIYSRLQPASKDAKRRVFCSRASPFLSGFFLALPPNSRSLFSSPGISETPPLEISFRERVSHLRGVLEFFLRVAYSGIKWTFDLLVLFLLITCRELISAHQAPRR